MARPLRLSVPDGIHHVTTRGLDRGAIFRDDDDRETFLRLLGRTVDRFDWRCLSYCLMDNHFHLLLRTPVPNLPRGMQQLKSLYARALNKRHGRLGPLYAGRYCARLVQQDAHLLTVFRYIAHNPVAAELCAEPAAWRWSAHAALIGADPRPDFLAVDEALSWFERSDGRRGPEAYAAFVAGAEPEHSAPPLGPVFGDAAFRQAVLPSESPSSEIPLREWGDGRPSLADLFHARDRNSAIARAYRGHGYSMSEIACHLGCHVSTVSRRLGAFERGMLDCKI